MKVKIVKRDGKYRRKFSLDTEDWVTLAFVLIIFSIAIIQFILWS